MLLSIHINGLCIRALIVYLSFGWYFVGEGNYGVVYKGRNKKSGLIGAVKIMDATLDKEEDILSELNVFLNFSSHENIIECYGIYLKKQEGTNDQLWIVMEVQQCSCYH